jgi:hypothetical protein
VRGPRQSGPLEISRDKRRHIPHAAARVRAGAASASSASPSSPFAHQRLAIRTTSATQRPGDVAGLDARELNASRSGQEPVGRISNSPLMWRSGGTPRKGSAVGTVNERRTVSRARLQLSQVLASEPGRNARSAVAPAGVAAGRPRARSEIAETRAAVARLVTILDAPFRRPRVADPQPASSTPAARISLRVARDRLDSSIPCASANPPRPRRALNFLQACPASTRRQSRTQYSRCSAARAPSSPRAARSSSSATNTIPQRSERDIALTRRTRRAPRALDSRRAFSDPACSRCRRGYRDGSRLCKLAREREPECRADITMSRSPVDRRSQPPPS